MRPFLIVLIFLTSALPALAQTMLNTSVGQVKVSREIEGLDEPWGLAFLPDGAMLVTERAGDLIYVQDGNTTRVRGVPRVFDNGQGGLLDVVAARDFAQSRTIFLSYSEPRRGGGGTALASAKLSTTGNRLTDVKVLFRQNQASRGGRHFGSRIVEAQDGTLFLTIGDRGDRPSAQDMGVHNGKVIRVARSGGIPSNNPFKSTATPETYSLGHRNPQGAALDAQGRLWVVEHGARGGDEVNLVEPSKNYGWPVISYGRHYSGGKIGEGTSKPGLEQPKHYWDPSIAPSGMMIYSGKMFPEWRGDVFVGSLKFDMISRLEGGAGGLREVERLFQDQFQRIRDIREAPDGSIWFLSVGDGAAYRVTRP